MFPPPPEDTLATTRIKEYVREERNRFKFFQLGACESQEMSLLFS
jgi:hypothetical protein